MNTRGYTRHHSQSFIRELGHNVRAAMLVGGPADGDGNIGRLRSVLLQRQTGIARTTLRALTSCKDEEGPNPDLKTLARLSEALDVPLAFLLMRPQDWETLSTAFNDLSDPLLAARETVRANLSVPAGTPEHILRKCKMLPQRVAYGLEHDRTEAERVAQRNEKCRRTSHVLGSLMLRNCVEHKHQVLLAALAAALANELSFDRSAARGDDKAHI
jgi:transcriptional regulator with XRE-family HTH domain